MDAAGDIVKVASMRRGNSGSMWRRGEDVFSRSSREEDDEEALRWAALEKLPTYDRVRRALVPSDLGLDDGAEAGGGRGLVDVDVLSLGPQQRRALLERLVRVADEDNERFLLKLKDRVDRYCAMPSPAPLARDEPRGHRRPFPSRRVFHDLRARARVSLVQGRDRHAHDRGAVPEPRGGGRGARRQQRPPNRPQLHHQHGRGTRAANRARSFVRCEIPPAYAPLNDD